AMLLLAAPLLPTRLIVQATPEVLFTLNGRMLEPALSLQQLARWVVIPAIWIAWGGLLWWQALRSRKEL
ncbi:MAG: hypothetical protein GYB64_08495, partial [Chloroflexi bacterium]|nr:hypothetical protein [Chloroflexota bacterium]